LLWTPVSTLRRQIPSARPSAPRSLLPRASSSRVRQPLVRHHRANDSVFLYAFDLIELNGDDLRRDPLEVRKATLASVLAKAGLGIRFNEHMRAMARLSSPMPARWGSKASCRNERTRPPFGTLDGLAQDEEPGGVGGEAGSGGRLGALTAPAGLCAISDPAFRDSN
jgi:hypothetical protein